MADRWELLAQATVRPWEVDPAFRCDIGHPGALGSEGEWDALVARSEDADDASLIVRAVNDYEALLDIAEAARDALTIARNPAKPTNALDGIVSILSAALARLDGGDRG